MHQRRQEDHDVGATVLVGLLEIHLRESGGDPGDFVYRRPAFPLTVSGVNWINRKQKLLLAVITLPVWCIVIAIPVTVLAILAWGIWFVISKF